jgi:hypothetical protein
MQTFARKAICGLPAAGLLVAAVALTGSPGVATTRSHHHSAAGQALKAAGVSSVGHPNIPVPGSRRPEVNGTTAVGSYNWSGYADTSSTAQTFKSVVGHWTVPAVKCTPEDRLESSWVGLDGATTNTVEQTGTLSWCYKGSPVYQSWYEMYPAASQTVGTLVKPGDHITASVVRSGTSYTLKLTDATTAGNNINVVSTCALATCKDESAEWIVERPAFSIGVTPLAQFTTTHMTGNRVNGAALASPTLQIGMIDATSAYSLAVPSALSGSAFSVKWLNSY